MSIPFSALKAKYEEVSALFIEQVNKTPITLYYNPQGTPGNTSSLEGLPQVMDEYGGRSLMQQLPDFNNREGTGILLTPTTGTLFARVYWNPKKDAVDIGIQDPQNVCKIITYVEDETSMVNAAYAVINGKQVKIEISPLRYGLMGEKQYSCSYWRVF